MIEQLELKAKTLTEMIDKLERKRYSPSSEREFREHYDYMVNLYGDLDQVYKQLFKLKQKQSCGI